MSSLKLDSLPDNPYQFTETLANDSNEVREPDIKESGLGIASFVLALIGVIPIAFAAIVLAAYVAESRQMVPPPERGGSFFAGLILPLLASVGTLAVSFVCGALSMVHAARRKRLGILGMIISASAFAIMLVLLFFA